MNPTSIPASNERPATRVLMVVPQYPFPIMGGLELQAHELSKALQRAGQPVQVISGKVSASQPARECVEGIDVYRIPWSPYKLMRFLRTPFDLFGALLARRAAYDVVHLHQCSWFGLFVILAARVLRKPVLTKLPNVREAGLPGMAASSFGALKLAIFRRTDAVIAMSNESIAELRAIGFPEHRVLATPNGIRLSEPCADATDSPRPATCRVVFVGRLSPEKMIDDLLAVWPVIVARARRPAQLELWGTGPAEAHLRALTAALGIADSVAFRGHVGDVRHRLPTMDIFVLPSSAEGNSNAVLEAMAAGLPIVSTLVGGTPMLVGPQGAPYLVASGDRPALAERLLALIDDQSERERRGQAMRERVRTHFDIDVVACTYAAAYARLALGRRNEMAAVSAELVMEG